MPEEPPVDPPEPFFWTRPAEPDPRTLRPIPALIGDTLRFVARQAPALVRVAVPAAAILILVGLVRWRAYESFAKVDGSDALSASAFSLVALALAPVAALGAYFLSTAIALLVVQHVRGGSMQAGAAGRLAVRRLPRIMTVNLVYGLLVGAVFFAPQFLLVPYLYDHDLAALWPWLYLGAGIVAYSTPQINVFFTAIKLEDRRPKFRQARQLVRGQRAATWGRVLLLQLVRVALTAAWQISGFGAWSMATVLLGTLSTVIEITILTTAFTLLYVDLAGVSADDPILVDDATLHDGSEAGHDVLARRPT
ncbi:hypothetical protein [Candidatus Poriferisodalis sp.]|uniref:hypothetical protein n=1 Tax=Candidatus Poriferisodalis sp. TaxID=3101277 RepID=UPI003C705D07